MKLPLQISFHNLDRSETIENRIWEEAEQLDEFCGRIMSSRVVVDKGPQASTVRIVGRNHHVG